MCRRQLGSASRPFRETAATSPLGIFVSQIHAPSCRALNPTGKQLVAPIAAVPRLYRAHPARLVTVQHAGSRTEQGHGQSSPAVSSVHLRLPNHREGKQLRVQVIRFLHILQVKCVVSGLTCTQRPWQQPVFCSGPQGHL